MQEVVKYHDIQEKKNIIHNYYHNRKKKKKDKRWKALLGSTIYNFSHFLKIFFFFLVFRFLHFYLFI